MHRQIWQTARFQIDLRRPQVMGIVNVTPDSFSDGGRYHSTQNALRHCEQLLNEGADILDIGGESSRPGAALVDVTDELARVLPVIEHACRLGVPVSVDTYKPQVMRAALDLGADIVNDIQALQQPGALQLLSEHQKVGICLMHMRGDAQTMQLQTEYVEIVQDLTNFLGARAQALEAAGIAKARIVLDPGYGFAKTYEQNFEILRRQQELLSLGYPLLAGWSRKGAIGTVTGRAVNERLAGSLAAALASVAHGASIVRVHDVAETVDALKVWQAATKN